MPATLRSIEQRFLQRQTEWTLRSGQKSQLDTQVAKVKTDKIRLEQTCDLYTKVQALLLAASSAARDSVQKKIEELTTLALSAITGSPYQFKMNLSQNTGAYTVSFIVVNPEGVELDPLEGCGGGIADICSMALRIAILEMYEPTIEGPILLDENMKFLSRDHVRSAAEFLCMLSERTGRQILLVTHIPELAGAAQKCLEVQPLGDTSEIIDTTPLPIEEYNL